MTDLESSAPSRTGVGDTPADAELLARWCTAGDSSAFELLVRRHGGMVFGVCRRTLGSSADADDAFQATFLILVQKARELAHPEQVAAWLHAVALRVARKARAMRDRRREREAEIVDAPDPTNPDPAAESRDLRRTLDEELDRLPEKYRLPIVLCELEGRTLEEAAQLLGWPKGTVAGRLSRGREMLRERLSRRGVGLPLFLAVPLPAVDLATPSEPLVSAALATATGTPAASQPAALAQAVLIAGLRKRLGLVAGLLLAAAALAAALGWQGRSAMAHSPPPAPVATGGCHAHTS